MSSTVGAKATKIVYRSRGRIIPPISRSVVLSVAVPQRAVQNLAARLFFLVSLKEKLSTRSSRVVGSRVDSVYSDVCAMWCIAHATRTRSPRVATAVWPSRAACRIPVMLSRTSMVTKREASVS